MDDLASDFVQNKKRMECVCQTENGRMAPMRPLSDAMFSRPIELPEHISWINAQPAVHRESVASRLTAK